MHKTMSQDEMSRRGRELLEKVPEPHRRRGAAGGAGVTVGAVVGSFLGGPVGAAAGAAIGGVVGVALGEKV